MFRYLGWDIFNENRVIFEDMTSTKKRVDATFIFDDNSKFLVEAKRLTHKLVMKDFEQLTLYINSDDSANFGILTNGIDYWIADNKQDGLEAKRIHTFNIFDMSECDLNILRMFFSFDPPYKLKDINRYINYIRTGLDFGDKKCEKVLEIKNFESDEIKAKHIHDDILNNNSSGNLNLKNNYLEDKNSAFKKPIFASEDLSFTMTNNNQEKEDNQTNPEKNKFEDSEEEINSNDVLSQNESKVQKTQAPNLKNISQENIDSTQKLDKKIAQFENNISNSNSETKLENKINQQPQNSQIAEPLVNDIVKLPFTGRGEKIEFFELIERNRAKIFLNGEYHIIADNGFPSLFIKMLRYIMKEVKLYPALYSKIIANFSFIEDSSNKSGKFEPISENYFYNLSVNNYTKLKNIEALLKFIHENFE